VKVVTTIVLLVITYITISHITTTLKPPASAKMLIEKRIEGGQISGYINRYQLFDNGRMYGRYYGESDYKYISVKPNKQDFQSLKNIADNLQDESYLVVATKDNEPLSAKNLGTCGAIGDIPEVSWEIINKDNEIIEIPCSKRINANNKMIMLFNKSADKVFKKKEYKLSEIKNEILD